MKLNKIVQATILGIGMALGGIGLTAAYACGSGECEPPPPETTGKANNGWGQEKKGKTDGTNPGSDEGKTQVSKDPSIER